MLTVTRQSSAAGSATRTARDSALPGRSPWAAASGRVCGRPGCAAGPSNSRSWCSWALWPARPCSFSTRADVARPRKSHWTAVWTGSFWGFGIGGKRVRGVEQKRKDVQYRACLLFVVTCAACAFGSLHLRVGVSQNPPFKFTDFTSQHTGLFVEASSERPDWDRKNRRVGAQIVHLLLNRRQGCGWRLWRKKYVQKYISHL